MNLDVYRNHVRKMWCPLCKAKTGEKCKKFNIVLDEWVELDYVHDDRSAAYHELRLLEIESAIDAVRHTILRDLGYNPPILDHRKTTRFGPLP